jgi:hypothetical protein
VALAIEASKINQDYSNAIKWHSQMFGSQECFMYFKNFENSLETFVNVDSLLFSVYIKNTTEKLKCLITSSFKNNKAITC